MAFESSLKVSGDVATDAVWKPLYEFPLNDKGDVGSAIVLAGHVPNHIHTDGAPAVVEVANETAPPVTVRRLPQPVFCPNAEAHSARVVIALPVGSNKAPLLGAAVVPRFAQSVGVIAVVIVVASPHAPAVEVVAEVAVVVAAGTCFVCIVWRFVWRCARVVPDSRTLANARNGRLQIRTDAIILF